MNIDWKGFTKEPHQELEKKLGKRIKAITTVKDYAMVLKLFLTFYAPIEARITQFITLEIVPDFNVRRKAELISNDLNTLNVQVENVASDCTELPQITDQYQALGALYVLEGSTLGGPFIKKIIAGRLPELNEEAQRFFAGYGGNSSAMWESFQNYLNRYLKEEVHQQRALHAAHETFKAFKNWIEQYES